ncbi:MAG TPA: succinylglutamate-semialdehyde dehydrogenase [Nevskiaceae bacterium]|nr:succinylglutamate-semialdehyde dehydrogenase [Nevskiaceae bacterium]
MSESDDDTDLEAGLQYIGGSWVEGVGEHFASVEPTNGDEIWAGPAADQADIDRAMDAAFEASEAWADAPFEQREKVVRAFAATLEKHKDQLAGTIAQETGKPLWESRTEVATMIAKVDISVKAWHARTPTSHSDAGGLRNTVTHRPHGVVAVFGPFNFPGHLPNGHIVPALLAGNCVLFKPSEQTPLVAQETMKLWVEAGIPKGVLQLLQGERQTGELIAAHKELDGLYFTGSSRTGEILMKQFAATPGRILALEMGGNNPLVVGKFSDARAVVHDIVQSAYLTAGQRCTCARRLYVPAGADGDALLKALAEAVQGIKVGPYDAEPQPFMGPLISVKAADAMLSAQTRLLALGAKALVEMKRQKIGRAFLSPGLLDCSDISNPPDEEHFGPLLKVFRYADFGDAIDLANDSRYGLSASLLSEDDAQWDRFRKRVRAGIINRNRPTTGASSAAPFGGIGHSGNHRPSAFYAADYCAFPVASVEAPKSVLPAELSPGLKL